MIVGAQAEMPAAPSAEPMPREWLLPVLAGMAIALAIFFVAWRRTGIARGLASRE